MLDTRIKEVSCIVRFEKRAAQVVDKAVPVETLARKRFLLAARNFRVVKK